MSDAQLCLITCHKWDTLGAMAAGWEAALIKRVGNDVLGPRPQIVGDDLNDVADQLIARHKGPLVASVLKFSGAGSQIRGPKQAAWIELLNDCYRRELVVDVRIGEIRSPPTRSLWPSGGDRPYSATFRPLRCLGERVRSTEAVEKRVVRRGRCAGIALGVDRLVMLCIGGSRTEDVL